LFLKLIVILSSQLSKSFKISYTCNFIESVKILNATFRKYADSRLKTIVYLYALVKQMVVDSPR